MQEGETYVSAVAWAEMAKNVTYKVDVKLGYILNFMYIHSGLFRDFASHSLLASHC